MKPASISILMLVALISGCSDTASVKPPSTADPLPPPPRVSTEKKPVPAETKPVAAPPEVVKVVVERVAATAEVKGEPKLDPSVAKILPIGTKRVYVKLQVEGLASGDWSFGQEVRKGNDPMAAKMGRSFVRYYRTSQGELKTSKTYITIEGKVGGAFDDKKGDKDTGRATIEYQIEPKSGTFDAGAYTLAFKGSQRVENPGNVRSSPGFQLTQGGNLGEDHRYRDLAVISWKIGTVAPPGVVKVVVERVAATPEVKGEPKLDPSVVPTFPDGTKRVYVKLQLKKELNPNAWSFKTEVRKGADPIKIQCGTRRTDYYLNADGTPGRSSMNLDLEGGTHLSSDVGKGAKPTGSVTLDLDIEPETGSFHEGHYTLILILGESTVPTPSKGSISDIIKTLPDDWRYQELKVLSWKVAPKPVPTLPDR